MAKEKAVKPANPPADPEEVEEPEEGDADAWKRETEQLRAELTEVKAKLAKAEDNGSTSAAGLTKLADQISALQTRLESAEAELKKARREEAENPEEPENPEDNHSRSRTPAKTRPKGKEGARREAEPARFLRPRSRWL